MAYTGFGDWFNSRVGQETGSTGISQLDALLAPTMQQMGVQAPSADDPAIKQKLASELVGGINGLGIPNGVSPDQILNYYRQQGGWESRPSPYDRGGLGGQLMEFGAPIAWMGSMAAGGPIAGTIAAANGSGATQGLGVDPRLTTAAGLAYGAYNSNPFGSTPDASVAGSEYGANNGQMVNGISGSGGGAGGNVDDWWTELGLTAQDVGMGDATPWSTNPSFSELGGNIDPSTGMPMGGGASGGGIMDLIKQYGPGALKLLQDNKGLIGALAGGLLGSKAQSTPAGTTTTTQDLPDWLKAYVMPNLNAAGGAQANLLGGPSVSGAAIPEYLKTMNGAYLDPASNPYLAGTYKTASDAVNANINSTFEGAGRYGSGAQAGAIGTADTNLANQIFGGNYQAERARQVAAVGGAPTFDTQRSAAAFAPFSDYKSLFPGSTATTTPYFTNPLGGILSGGLAGGMLGRMV